MKGQLLDIFQDQKKYEAVKPKDAINNVIDKKRLEYDQVAKKSDEIITLLNNIGEKNEFTNEGKTVFVSTDITNHVMIESIDQTRKCMQVITQIGLLTNTTLNPTYNAVATAVQRLIKRGVKIKAVMVNPNRETLNATIKKELSVPNVELKESHKLIDISVVIFDHKKCYIKTTAMDDYSLTPFILSNNFVLIKLAEAYFEGLW